MKSKTLIFLFITGFSFAINILKAQWTLSTPNIYNNNTGNVGIKNGGTAFVPTALFQVQNGSVLFEGTTGLTPVSGAGTRMMWVPSKNAFRAGQVGGTQWDDINIGSWSAAFGIHTTAKGTASFASGSSTAATGNYSTAFGNATISSSTNSTAFGSSTRASGATSFAAGGSTTASGTLTTTFGNNTIAQSNNSFVIGRYNYNPGTYNTTTWIATEPLFVIGNGSSAVATSNAMTVLKNGNVGFGIVSPPSKLSILSGLTKANSFSVNNADVHTAIFNQPATNAGVIQVYSGGSVSSIGASAYMLQLQPEGGNVGIGLNSGNPTEKLDINGTMKVNGNAIYLALDRNHGLGYFNIYTTTGNYANKNFDGPVLFGFNGGALGTNQGANRNVALSWNNAGQVGIGSKLDDPTSSGYMLLVNGDIRAKKIVVETSWSDFVFEDNYKLKTLEEVETFIKQNGHLPEIPSAKEIECNGGDLGYLVKLQMQKIEELTLYIIDQQQQIDKIRMELK